MLCCSLSGGQQWCIVGGEGKPSQLHVWWFRCTNFPEQQDAPINHWLIADQSLITISLWCHSAPNSIRPAPLLRHSMELLLYHVTIHSTPYSWIHWAVYFFFFLVLLTNRGHLLVIGLYFCSYLLFSSSYLVTLTYNHPVLTLPTFLYTVWLSIVASPPAHSAPCSHVWWWGEHRLGMWQWIWSVQSWFRRRRRPTSCFPLHRGPAQTPGNGWSVQGEANANAKREFS